MASYLKTHGLAFTRPGQKFAWHKVSCDVLSTVIRAPKSPVGFFAFFELPAKDFVLVNFGVGDLNTSPVAGQSLSERPLLLQHQG